MGDLIAFPGVVLPAEEKAEPALISDDMASALLDVAAKIEMLFEADDSDEFAEIMAALKARVEEW